MIAPSEGDASPSEAGALRSPHPCDVPGPEQKYAQSPY